MLSSKKVSLTTILTCILGATWFAQAQAAVDVQAVYKQYCSECHSLDRLGGNGPALLPQNLKRLRKKSAFDVIKNGRVASQMLPFKEKINDEEIKALVELIYTPLKEVPVWGMEQIKASQIVTHKPGELPDTPKFKADIWNLFMVVELGDHHATLLNGDTFEPIHRLPTRFALHGGPKWAENGRYIYFASRDGWISKFDVFNLTYVAKIQAGINTRNLAVSHDGRYVIVANYLPHTLTILDARDLSPIKVLEVKDSEGKSSRVSAVYTADPRNSFVAALKDIPEIWEINYSDDPPPGFAGWEHSYHPEAGDLVKSDPFPVRRIELDSFLDDFLMNQEYTQVIGTSREGKGQVVDLDVGRALYDMDISGMPHLSSGITWNYQGKPVLATPDMKHGLVSIVDMQSWKTIKKIKTKGPGFFMRSHENSPYAWVDVFFGPNKDLMHVIDKQTLEIVKTLKPAPGKTSAHVEFTKDGKYAIVSIWDPDGAIVIYDANTLKEVKRLPMKKPSGKYNVHNKLTRSSGTSH